MSIGTGLQDYSTVRKKKLVVRVADYQLIAGHLYKMGTDSILKRYVLEHEIPRVLVEAHEGIAGGNYVGKSTMQDFGGQRFIDIQRNTIKHVMFCKG